MTETNGCAALFAKIKQGCRYVQIQNLKTFLSTVRSADKKV